MDHVIQIESSAVTFSLFVFGLSFLLESCREIQIFGVARRFLEISLHYKKQSRITPCLAAGAGVSSHKRGIPPHNSTRRAAVCASHFSCRNISPLHFSDSPMDASRLDARRPRSPLANPAKPAVRGRTKENLLALVCRRRTRLTPPTGSAPCDPSNRPTGHPAFALPCAKHAAPWGGASGRDGALGYREV